ncbi:hypothetical protein JCM30566_12750 [Marinitoga arctica]
MKKLGDFVIKHSKGIFIFVLGLTIISIILTFSLEIRPGFLDLLPSKDPYVKVYEEATKSFKSVDSIIIGIEGSRENIINYIEDISEKLKNIDYVDAIFYKNPIDFISKNIFLLSPNEEQIFLKKVYSSNNIADFFESLNEMFEEPEGGYRINEHEKQQFDYMINSFNNLLISMNEEDLGKLKNEFLNFLFGEKYLLSKSGKFGMIIIRPTISSNDINKVVELVNSVENIVKESAVNYNVKAGLTGTLVIARDEMVMTERDMAIATTVSLILILIIFMLGFRSFRYTFLSAIPLIFGIIWTLGFTKITIGSLNIMTVMMGAILAGLGIDYSIHIISLYIELRNKGLSKVETLKGVFEKNIRGVIAGAITTAIGIGIFAISSFPGFREFGIVLSSGIIFTLLAEIFGLTAILKMFGNKYKNPGKVFVINYDVNKYRKLSIILIIIFVLLSVLKIKNVDFDKNMMNIEAKGLESIELNDKILKEFNFSPDNTIFISDDLVEAKDLYNKLKNIKIFSQIDSISLYLPETASQVVGLKNAYEIKNMNLEKKELDIKKLKSEINKLNFNLTKTALSLNLLGYKDLSNKLKDIVKSGVLIKISNKKIENFIKLQNVIIQTISDLRENLNSTELITIEKLPEEIKSNYLGENGKILTTAYSNGDIWNVDYQKNILIN